MNERSSRSHSVITVIVTTATNSAKLVFVDLAGNEMIRKTNDPYP